MKREVFGLLIVSAATAYLFYYVLKSGGSYFAGLSVSMLSIYFIKAWSDFFLQARAQLVTGGNKGETRFC